MQLLLKGLALQDFLLQLLDSEDLVEDDMGIHRTKLLYYSQLAWHILYIHDVGKTSDHLGSTRHTGMGLLCTFHHHLWCHKCNTSLLEERDSSPGVVVLASELRSLEVVLDKNLEVAVVVQELLHYCIYLQLCLWCYSLRRTKGLLHQSNMDLVYLVLLLDSLLESFLEWLVEY